MAFWNNFQKSVRLSFAKKRTACTVLGVLTKIWICGDIIPQGLKPDSFCTLYGTAEAVP